MDHLGIQSIFMCQFSDIFIIFMSVISPPVEVQWAYSGHLVHLQWGTVHALYVIYSGHCSYTVARYSVHTVVTYSVHTVDTLYVHCIPTVVYSAHCSYTVTRLQWIYSVSTVYIQCTN